MYPDLSPFAFPSSSRFASPSPSVDPYPSLVLALAGTIIANQPWGQWQLIQDESSADPASVGPAVILANWTMGETLGGRNQSGVGGAAEAQIWALLLETPRASDGAISHRVDSVELWSDFVCEPSCSVHAPLSPPRLTPVSIGRQIWLLRYVRRKPRPGHADRAFQQSSRGSFRIQFFAYYGLMTRNASLIQLAYDQVRLYREGLQDPATKLWRHIYVPGGGSNSDPGLWATGEPFPPEDPLTKKGCGLTHAYVGHQATLGSPGASCESSRRSKTATTRPWYANSRARAATWERGRKRWLMQRGHNLG